MSRIAELSQHDLQAFINKALVLTLAIMGTLVVGQLVDRLTPAPTALLTPAASAHGHFQHALPVASWASSQVASKPDLTAAPVPRKSWVF